MIDLTMSDEEQDDLTDYDTCPHCGSDELEFSMRIDQEITTCLDCGTVAEDCDD